MFLHFYLVLLHIIIIIIIRVHSDYNVTTDSSVIINRLFLQLVHNITTAVINKKAA